MSFTLLFLSQTCCLKAAEQKIHYAKSLHYDIIHINCFMSECEYFCSSLREELMGLIALSSQVVFAELFYWFMSDSSVYIGCFVLCSEKCGCVVC